MLPLLLSVLVVFVLLCVSEFGWRRHWFHGEVGRKFVHITVGSFVAFWPYYLNWTQVRLLSLAFLVVVGVSQWVKLFKAIHSVQRPTYGEICFALVVGALTFVTHSKQIYAVALLQMSLADGLAAIVGTRFGRGNSYHFWGHTKSVAGTLTFAFVSAVLLAGYAICSGHHQVGMLAIGVLGSALLENVAALGLDNLAVPLFTAWLLTVW